MGVDDVINKPFNPSIIRRRVKNTIELYERRLRMESIIEGQTRKIKEQSENDCGRPALQWLIP